MGEVSYLPLGIDFDVFLHPKEFENVGRLPLYIASCNEIVLDESLAAEADILMKQFLVNLVGRKLSVGIMSLACALSCLMGNALAATSGYDTQLDDGMVLVISKMQKGTANAEENLS